MASKAEKEKQKLIQEKCQTILSDLLRDEDNKYCVDCDAKGPRWASWNLGIFLCIRCAGIHRNLGVHISKVKSVNLDSWTPEQIACIQNMGNSKARAVYEANLPDNFRRPQTDSTLEAFVRAKYEQKKYIAKEWIQPPPPKAAFDIDDELRKEKERKRNKVKPQNAANIEVQANSLPRPHSSPAGTAINADKIPQDMNKKGDAEKSISGVDLLGLNIGNLTADSTVTNTKTEDDTFGMFMSSAPVTTKNSNEDSSVVKSDKVDEEADFFNQKAPDEKKVLSKESILSLYGSGGGGGGSMGAPQMLASAAPQQTPFANQQSLFMPQFPSSVTQLPQQPPQGGIFIPQTSVASGMSNATQMSQQSLFPLTTNPFLSHTSNTAMGQLPAVTQLPQQMSALQIGHLGSGPNVPVNNAPNNWFPSQGAMNFGNNVPIPPPGLINPFMAASPLIHAGVPASNNFSAMNSTMFGQNDMVNPNPQWGLTANTALGQQTGVTANNLWQ